MTLLVVWSVYKLKKFATPPLRMMQEIARRIAEVAKEPKLPLEEGDVLRHLCELMR